MSQDHTDGQQTDRIAIKRPETLFPLVRHLSCRVTPLLARTPLSANMITTLSLGFGLFCVFALMQGEQAWGVVGAVAFIVAYILDNCDGEIARLKNQSSTFGMHFDSFVDWVVHTGFFIGLGIGATRASGDDLWFWVGLVAGAGGTINYVIMLVSVARAANRKDNNQELGDSNEEEPSRKPEGVRQWLVFAFRELTRADFCFIVLGLAMFDLTWVLLPAGAIGSQVYWITQFFEGAREFHA